MTMNGFILIKKSDELVLIDADTYHVIKKRSICVGHEEVGGRAAIYVNGKVYISMKNNKMHIIEANRGLKDIIKISTQHDVIRKFFHIEAPIGTSPGSSQHS